jgi:hypothetical protein
MLSSTRGRSIVPGSVDADRSRTTEFFDRVCAMPRAAWLTVGDTELARTAERSLPLSVALAALGRVIAEQQLDVPAWYVRDEVTTAACLAHGTCGVSRRDERRFEAARDAVERAALAHLARPWLASRDFEQLIAPVGPPTGACA